MGLMIRAVDFSPDREGILRPVVYVNPDRNIANQAVSINTSLAKALQPIAPKRRAMRMQLILQKIVQELPADSVLCEIDAMFNPQYRVDVVQTLISVCRAVPFSVVWPGTYEDGKLIYAVEGRPDYKTFEIANYDITCVI